MNLKYVTMYSILETNESERIPKQLTLVITIDSDKIKLVAHIYIRYLDINYCYLIYSVKCCLYSLFFKMFH